MDLILGNIVGFFIGCGLMALYLRLNWMLERLDRKLDWLIKHSGIDVTKLAHDQAAALARDGKMIEAIKVYRESTGCSLAEAKAKVETMD